MSNVPVIKIEIERMKHTMLTMLSEHSAQLDADMRAAVESYCSEGNIQRVINQAAREAMDAAIKEEVRRFFQYSGAGRAAIREAVLQHLNEQFPEATS